MNNNELQNIAQKIVNKIKIDHEDQEKFGSIIIILSIISIILTLIRVIQECDKSKIKLFSQTQKYEYFSAKIKEITIRRSWFTKMTIKKSMRREFSKEYYQKYGIQLMNAILDIGENLKDDQIQILVEAANV